MILYIIIGYCIAIFIFLPIFILSKTLHKCKKKIIAQEEIIRKLNLQNQYSFEKDMEFLNFLINYKCNVYYELVIRPLSDIKDNRLLNDTDLNNAVEEITLNIGNAINKDYLNVIYKYFDVEGFKVYLTEIVLTTFTKMITLENKNKIKRMNNRQNNTNDNLSTTKSDID